MEGFFFVFLLFELLWFFTFLAGTYLLLKVIYLITKASLLKNRAFKIIISIFVAISAAIAFNDKHWYFNDLQLPLLLCLVFTTTIFFVKPKVPKQG
ncbi:hypothetical protein A3860_06760 [Niastella vici]|uniref:Uncharacterized protein n=1 Tax=Niastella vici TaxID=1703345 RepID=A0A1V9FT45_9BACT|nr:hypothetical protein A3860_06760 [Niastella vici]